MVISSLPAPKSCFLQQGQLQSCFQGKLPWPACLTHLVHSRAEIACSIIQMLVVKEDGVQHPRFTGIAHIYRANHSARKKKLHFCKTNRLTKWKGRKDNRKNTRNHHKSVSCFPFISFLDLLSISEMSVFTGWVNAANIFQVFS